MTDCTRRAVAGVGWDDRWTRLIDNSLHADLPTASGRRATASIIPPRLLPRSVSAAHHAPKVNRLRIAVIAAAGKPDGPCSDHHGIKAPRNEPAHSTVARILDATP